MASTEGNPEADEHDEADPQMLLLMRLFKTLLERHGDIDGITRFAEKMPKPPYWNEVHSVVTMSQIEQNDRAVAIVMTALCDDLLRDLISRRIADGDTRAAKEVVERQSMESRISLAFCIGLISTSQAQDLRTIAKIRNRFAHEHDSVTFDSSASSIGSLKTMQQIKLNNAPLDVSSLSARERFVLATSCLIQNLQMILHTVPRIAACIDGTWPFSSPLDGPLGDVNASDFEPESPQP